LVDDACGEEGEKKRLKLKTYSRGNWK